MKIVMTGGTGFVGRALIRRLVPDHHLYCLGRQADALPPHERVTGIAVDLSRPLDVARLPEQVDAIVHLAQSRHFREFADRADDIFRVNTDSTFQLLEYAKKARAGVFVYASSGGVCGYQAQPIRETDPPMLMNFYLASKYAAECLVNAYSEVFRTVILRYFFVYGEGQRNMFMPGLIGRVRQGDAVTVNGKSGIAMNPVHVSDAVEATARALHLSWSDTFNVAGPDSTTIADLARLIGRRLGREPTFQQEPDKGPMGMIANIEKMTLKLGVSPKVSLEEGVARLIEDLQRDGRP